MQSREYTILVSMFNSNGPMILRLGMWLAVVILLSEAHSADKATKESILRGYLRQHEGINDQNPNIHTMSSTPSHTVDDIRHENLSRELGEFRDYFHCAADPWPVEEDAASMESSSKMIQEFLFAWHHNPARCARSQPKGYSHSGIGSTYLLNMIKLAESLEFGSALIPTDNYFWAKNYDNCTLNLPRLDCYTEEISNCGYTYPSTVTPEPNNKNEFQTDLGKIIWPTPPSNAGTPIDVCVLGKVLKKSVAWVTGEYFKYLIRPTPYTQGILDSYKQDVFKNIKPGTSTVTIHLRGGNPDIGRKVVSLDKYMAALNRKAEELANSGRPVSQVYLVSADNEGTFHNLSYVQERYPGPWEYKLLPRTSHINGSNVEVELMLAYDFPELSRAPFWYEFMADMQLMFEADCYIGSFSTAYLVVTFMRYTKAHAHANQKYNCFIDNGETFICEDNDAKYEILRLYFLDKYNAFTGGTPF